ASTADPKSLRHKRRIRSGTSDRQSGTRINKFASAHDFPKFVKVGAAMEHELRKVGTSVLDCEVRNVAPQNATNFGIGTLVATLRPLSLRHQGACRLVTVIPREYGFELAGRTI